MKPVDFRHETFETIRARVVLDRAACLAALRACGPCTTRELARRMGRDILNVRPRVTELVQLGFVVTEDAAGREGVYRALDDRLARQHIEHRIAATQSPQLDLFTTTAST
jgi:predicted transcriptional regulator